MGTREKSYFWFFLLLDHEFGNDAGDLTLLIPFQLVDRSLELQQVLVRLWVNFSFDLLLALHCCY